MYGFANASLPSFPSYRLFQNPELLCPSRKGFPSGSHAACCFLRHAMNRGSRRERAYKTSSSPTRMLGTRYMALMPPLCPLSRPPDTFTRAKQPKLLASSLLRIQETLADLIHGSVSQRECRGGGGQGEGGRGREGGAHTGRQPVSRGTGGLSRRRLRPGEQSRLPLLVVFMEMLLGELFSLFSREA